MTKFYFFHFISSSSRLSSFFLLGEVREKVAVENRGVAGDHDDGAHDVLLHDLEVNQTVEHEALWW